jgi:hypothetical protein
MTYEVHFKLRDAEYTVRGPDTAGILALIDGLEPKGEVPPQRLREAYAQLMAQEPLPEIEDPHAELRKTWAPGQKWLTRSKEHIGKAGGQWLYVAGGEPHWHADQEYRRAPEDGWVTMVGGNRPVRAHAKVMVRNRDTGSEYGPYPAHTIVWENVGAYLVIEP